MRDVCLLGLRLYSMLLHGRYTFPFFFFLHFSFTGYCPWYWCPSSWYAIEHCSHAVPEVPTGGKLSFGFCRLCHQVTETSFVIQSVSQSVRQTDRQAVSHSVILSAISESCHQWGNTFSLQSSLPSFFLCPRYSLGSRAATRSEGRSSERKIQIDLYPLFSRLHRQNSTPTLIPPATKAAWSHLLNITLPN